MSIFDRALAKVEAGKSGLNVGIPIAFQRLQEYLPNIQQKTTYLIGAGTKVGKTSFADDVFFYGAYDYFANLKKQGTLEGFDLDIDYFTFEIDEETKILKGVTRKIWLDYGILVDTNTILSRGKNHCSDEIYDIVLTNREYFEELESVCTMHAMPDNPTGKI
jgi:replicative DNA helicase